MPSTRINPVGRRGQIVRLIILPFFDAELLLALILRYCLLGSRDEVVEWSF